MRCVPVLLLAACGTAAPAATPHPPAKHTAVVQSATCADAGVLLAAADEDVGEDPEFEHAIAEACVAGGWSPHVLGCITKVASPVTCLGQLTEDQASAYTAALEKWNGGVNAIGVSCDQGVARVEGWPPRLTGDDDAVELSKLLRRQALKQRCDEDNWSSEALNCVASGETTDVASCMSLFSTDHALRIHKAINDADSLARRTAAQHKKPASLECKKVAAAHYAQARWKTAIPAITGADRKKLFDESRTKMTLACIDEKWSADVRACLATGGGVTCDAVGNIQGNQRLARYGFPAKEVERRVALPECQGYADVVERAAGCAKLETQLRETIKDQYFSWVQLSPTDPEGDRGTQLNTHCHDFVEVLRHDVAKAGCPL
jgi:hypothetical protein